MTLRETLEYLSSFEYKGGGYFRKKGVPKGESAETLHGSEIQAVIDKALREEKERNDQDSQE